MNKSYKDYFYLFIGIIGSLITLIGYIFSLTQIYFVVGSSLLLILAIHFGLLYFIALEMILIAGHTTVILGIGAILQLALPVLLCVQLLFFYYFIGRLNDIFLIIGIFGIAIISVGFAYENQWIFFAGSTAISIYAFHNWIKNQPALLWAILNTLFSLTAIIKICKPVVNKLLF